VSELSKKKCVPCEGGTKPLPLTEAARLLTEVPGWSLQDESKAIRREFRFGTFLDAMEFVSQVADIAEIEDHHPDIHIFYNRVRLDLSTHAIKGLSENDFIVAAKINTLPVSPEPSARTERRRNDTAVMSANVPTVFRKKVMLCSFLLSSIRMSGG
jgi:4a-hydroxytetrahydrobiopterin dehydratase